MAYIRNTKGLGSDDPGQALSSAIQSAKDNLGTAAIFGIMILAGVGYLLCRSGRR